MSCCSISDGARAGGRVACPARRHCRGSDIPPHDAAMPQCREQARNIRQPHRRREGRGLRRIAPGTGHEPEADRNRPVNPGQGNDRDRAGSRPCRTAWGDIRGRSVTRVHRMAGNETDQPGHDPLPGRQADPVRPGRRGPDVALSTAISPAAPACVSMVTVSGSQAMCN